MLSWHSQGLRQQDVIPCPQGFLKDACRGKRQREGMHSRCLKVKFGAGWIISAQYPHNYWASTGTVILLLLNSPLNPLHCSAVKSTSSPEDYSPPSAAFITKFMMKLFCVLFLQWSRYQRQTCSQGTECTNYDCMNATVMGCAASLQ